MSSNLLAGGVGDQNAGDAAERLSMSKSMHSGDGRNI